MAKNRLNYIKKDIIKLLSGYKRQKYRILSA